LEVEVKDEGDVEIFLFDDGKGFDPEENYDGNGLKNMKKRADMIDGIIDIDSRPNVGTKILFKGIIPSDYLKKSSKVA
jgi:signal transduction histidine kinase